MPDKTTRSGVGEAWLAQRESPWNPLGNLSLRIAKLHNGAFATPIGRS